MPDVTKVLTVIQKSEDADQLRRLLESARREKNELVAKAAFARLTEVLPSEAPGTVEHDFWKMIYAFEEVLREERGKTVLLSRTRQKVKRVGVIQTLTDFSTSPRPTEGFLMLMERGLAEMTGEAVVLKHTSVFPSHVLRAAADRLRSAGVDIEKLVPGYKDGQPSTST